MKITTVNEENILNDETQLVDLEYIKSEEFKKIVDDMVKTCIEHGGAGLSANQVNINKKFFIYLNNEKYSVIINPTIKVRKDIVSHYDEGCLSIPGVLFDVKRYKTIVMECLNSDGEKLTLRSPNKFTAFIWQHEIDHLNGILISDRGKRK